MLVEEQDLQAIAGVLSKWNLTMLFICHTGGTGLVGDPMDGIPPEPERF